MIGVKYVQYYPEKVLQLLPGLAIYKSWFKNADGVFTETETSH